MHKPLRDRLREVLDGWACPDIATDAVMEVIAPILAERDQYRAVAQFAEAQRAHQRQKVQELQENDRLLRRTLQEVRDLVCPLSQQ